MPPASRLPDFLAERYGRNPRTASRRRAAGIAALAALGVALLVLLVSAAWRFSTPDVRVGLLAFDVTDGTRVDVTFEVVADAQATLVCDVSGQNALRAVVGSSTVEVAPTGQARRVVRASVPTREPAVTGLVERCLVASK